MDSKFAVEVTHVNGDVGLFVSGDIDRATAPLLEAACDRLAAMTDRVVLDLAGVTFMDCSGLRVILNARRHLGSGSVVMSNCPDRVQRLLDITRLTDDLIEPRTATYATPLSATFRTHRHLADATHPAQACKPDPPRRSRRIPRECTTWESGPGEPPATVTVTWGIDAHDTTTIDLTGELCARTVQEISELITHVARCSPANVAVDASSVAFIDTRGLSLLLGLQSQLAERALSCRIVSPSRIVRRLFRLAGVEDRLQGHLMLERAAASHRQAS